MNQIGNSTSIALVLPPREAFGPGRAGAVGLKVQRFAKGAADGGAPPLRAIVVAARHPPPVFDDVAVTCAVPGRWLPLPLKHRYALACAAVLRAQRPAMIEVYGRADLALALAARFPRTPVVLALANDPQTMRKARTQAERSRLLSRLAWVHANSTFTLDRMLEGVDASQAWYPPAVIPNGLDLAALPVPPPPAAREQLILYAGRIVPEKGVDRFVAACAAALPRLPGWRAEIIGAHRFGPGTPETDFIRGVRHGAAAAGIAMLGYQPHDAVLAAMRRAAIIVVPSRWQEPFGMTALEAMASGGALLCAPRGGLLEVGGDAPLYIDPDDSEALAADIVRVATDPAWRARLAEACRARAVTFDLAGIVARLNAHRRRILEAWPSR